MTAFLFGRPYDRVTRVRTTNAKKLNMKANTLLLGIAVLLLPGLSRAEIQWGATTNGVQLGLEITNIKVGPENPPLCIVYVKNTGNALLDAKFKKAEDFRVDLLGPSNQKVKVKLGKWISEESTGKRKAIRTNDVRQVTFFSVPDLFLIETNGPHKLIVSIPVSTNFPGRWERTYFLLPPVTNTVELTLR